MRQTVLRNSIIVCFYLLVNGCYSFFNLKWQLQEQHNLKKNFYMINLVGLTVGLSVGGIIKFCNTTSKLFGRLTWFPCRYHNFSYYILAIQSLILEGGLELFITLRKHVEKLQEFYRQSSKCNGISLWIWHLWIWLLKQNRLRLEHSFKNRLFIISDVWFWFN